MSFLFGRARQKSPQELVRSVRENMSKLDQPLSKRAAAEELSRTLAQMKFTLQGNAENEPVPEQVNQVAQEVYNTDMLPVLAVSFSRLDFEARKDTTSIFNALLRHVVMGQQPCVNYLTHTRPDTLILLLNGYERSDVATNCGQILREAFKYEALARMVLYDDSFWLFFTFVQGGRFDVSSDAFSTFKDLLTRHKAMVAEFLETNYEAFFDKYNTLLVSENYITKRQSIKLLGEILLDRANYNIMTAYVDSPEHLKLCMNLLRDKSKNVQYEAFHVFKVFVANPKKSKPVEGLLLKNRDQLLRFLPKFHEDRKEDDQFNDEKAFLMKQIEQMSPQSGMPI